MASNAETAEDPVLEQHAQAHHEPHVISIPVLLGTFAALIVLTVITVGATAVDLGPTGNLAVALIIAAMKATLVALIFMHLWFDQKYNVMVFCGALLFVFLFVSITFIDVSHYQSSIRAVDIETPADVVAEPAPTAVPTVPASPPAGPIRVPEGGGPRTAPTAH